MGKKIISNESINESKENKKEKKWVKWILFVIILLLILGIGSCAAYNHFGKSDDSEFEENVNKIVEIPYEERQAAIDKIVEEGMINIEYKTKAVFKGKVSKSFNVRNIENNHHPLVFEIIDENDDVIYKSKKIEPGYEIRTIELEKELKKGIHECQIKIGYAEEGNVSSVFPIAIEVK